MITATNTPQKEAIWRAFYRWATPKLTALGQNLFHWSWCKSLLYWLILSGGTMSELAFLIGAIWMSLNATVHPFILLFLSQEQTRYLTFLATSAYVALPELIVSLAVITTINHIRTLLLTRDWTEVIWILLYGIPAAFFAGISAYTIGESVANINFIIPEPLVIARALAGFLFAFTSLLHWRLGQPQEADRLAARDARIASLINLSEADKKSFDAERIDLNAAIEEERTRLTSIINGLKTEVNTAQHERDMLAMTLGKTSDTASVKDRELQSLNAETAILKATIEALKNELSHAKERALATEKTTENPLQPYGDDCIEWLTNSGRKSAFISDIAEHTGLSTRKIKNALVNGVLRTAPTNDKLVLFSALLPWLARPDIVASRLEPDTGPQIQVVGATQATTA